MIMANKFSTIDPETCTIEEGEAEVKRLEALTGFYETKQLALKKFINSVYGATASKYFTAHNTAVAESITLQGQDLNHFSENSVNAYFKGVFQADTALHEKLGIKTEDAQKVTISAGRVTEMKPLTGSVFNYLNGDTESLTIAGDTDSVEGNSIIHINEKADTIENWFNEFKYANNDMVLNINNGTGVPQEIVPVKNATTPAVDYQSDNYTIQNSPIKYIMRHKVVKRKYKITGENGKSVIVTEDHSCTVLRDNKVIVLKPYEINIETDKLLTYNE